MGQRGPVPKRSEDRKRRNESRVDKVVTPDVPVVVPPPSDEWDSIARRLWESMEASAQSRFYEPSDWAFAYFLMDEITRYRASGRVSGMNLNAILSGLNVLMLTEGDRRRVGLELARGGDDGDTGLAAVEVMAKWQKQMGS